MDPSPTQEEREISSEVEVEVANKQLTFLSSLALAITVFRDCQTIEQLLPFRRMFEYA